MDILWNVDCSINVVYLKFYIYYFKCVFDHEEMVLDFYNEEMVLDFYKGE